ncbi:MAG: adenylate/guanylate cyclase domain-containing protein [Candidatus Nanopelagicales bacterium]|nr:adenylate/guanylate cyclase domain-containing protein [Candidatus Nanopelagicales bacterium]
MTDAPDPRAEALARLTALVLAAPLELTREEASAAAGLTVEQARPYWRAMGFADVGGERLAFTRTDVAALQLLVGWTRDGLLDEARAVEIVRSLGQTASRLADWQVDTMARILAEADEPVEMARVGEGMAEVLPGLESLLVHAWRRHLAALAGRVLAMTEVPGQGEGIHEPGDLAAATVGFADIAGFTRLARVLGEDELSAMVEAFETGAADIVAGHGARLVKTLGDEVMFVAEDPDTAVGIALSMHALPRAGDPPTRLRIGLATGRLISLMGDYYGETVNRASRLTAIAKPGGTMIDPATEEGLGDPGAYLVRHHRPRALRGIGLVRAASVSRPR